MVDDNLVVFVTQPASSDLAGLLADLQAGQPDAPTGLLLQEAQPGQQVAWPQARTILLVPYRNREHHLWVFHRYFKAFFQVRGAYNTFISGTLNSQPNEKLVLHNI